MILGFPLTFAMGALAASLIITLGLEWACHRLLLFDHPGDRKIHTRPVPRMGGMAFFVVPLFFYLIGTYDLTLGFLLGAICVYLGGFYDDLHPANSALVKLATQVPASLIFATTVDLSFLSLSPPLIIALRVIIGGYVLFMINAANLMDNMNGLTSGLAVVWLGGLALSAQMHSSTSQTLLVLIFSILGFYLRNFPWGKIYMGDQGSQLLGFSLAGLSVLTLPSLFGNGPIRILTGTSIALFIFSAMFIFDVLTVSIIRLREGRPIWRGDQSHLSHQLVKKGFSPTNATLILTLGQLLLAGCGSAWVYFFSA